MQEPEEHCLWPHQVIQGLNLREQTILDLRFGSKESLRLSDAFVAMGLSHYKAHRLEQQAMAKSGIKWHRY